MLLLQKGPRTKTLGQAHCHRNKLLLASSGPQRARSSSEMNSRHSIKAELMPCGALCLEWLVVLVDTCTRTSWHAFKDKHMNETAQ